ncbi:hypothetical protein D3C72_1303340 [compost metagenome]
MNSGTFLEPFRGKNRQLIQEFNLEAARSFSFCQFVSKLSGHAVEGDALDYSLGLGVSPDSQKSADHGTQQTAGSRNLGQYRMTITYDIGAVPVRDNIVFAGNNRD